MPGWFSKAPYKVHWLVRTSCGTAQSQYSSHNYHFTCQANLSMCDVWLKIIILFIWFKGIFLSLAVVGVVTLKSLFCLQIAEQSFSQMG